MRKAAVALLASLALIPLSAAGVSADANPANHGHHYGQIKHHRAPTPPPPPVTPPAPATTPANVPPPATTTPPPAGSGSDASHGTGSGTIGSTIASQPLEVRPAFPSTGSVNRVTAAAQRNQDPWWLLLILAVSLAALWSFAFVRLARIAWKRRTVQAAA